MDTESPPDIFLFEESRFARRGKPRTVSCSGSVIRRARIDCRAPMLREPKTPRYPLILLTIAYAPRDPAERPARIRRKTDRSSKGCDFF